MASFTVEIDDYDLKDEGYHHTDDCEKACTTCTSDADNENLFLAATDALADWHETTHGYTLWSMCQQEPCKVLTIDYRKRT